MCDRGGTIISFTHTDGNERESGLIKNNYKKYGGVKTNVSSSNLYQFFNHNF